VKVPNDQVDRIREATNIVDLVGEHVKLRKRGRNWTGLCPFHNEKTPSFSVLEDKGIFKCFGCGKGGDVFSFVMQVEGLTFPEALQKLAKRANIDLEPIQSDEAESARSERETILNLIREAAGFYYRTLRSPQGADGLSFLRKRGFDDDIMRKFGLGFAPEQSGALIEALESKGFSIERMEAAGLVARRDNGGHYERFRGRVIFPVFNATGRIVGFGGRILPGTSKDLAKYVNSPETSVYHKSQILYGLYQAKDSIRQKKFAILVEGYADVLAVHQAGIHNAVAASGTSLTTEQLSLLRRYTTSVVLLFDADNAGRNATQRGIELAIEAGFDVNTVVLPAGEDPDSFIQKNGREQFEAAIDHKQSFIETKAQWFEDEGAFRDPAQMANAVRAIVETIAKVPDAIKRAFYIQKLGERFHLSEQLLSTELMKLISGNAEREERRPQKPEKVEVDEDLYGDNHDQPVPLSEGALLGAILREPVEVTKVLESIDFNFDLITHHAVREMIGFVMQRVEENEPPTIAQLHQEYRGKEEFETLLNTYSITHGGFSSNWENRPEEGSRVGEARHAIAALERGAVEQELKLVRSQILRAGNEEEESQLMQRSMILSQKLELLKELWTEGVGDEIS